MQFGLSESQQILKNNARKFFAAECPMTEVRRIMETETAHDEQLWRHMAEQGFLGVVIPEEAGGMGLGMVELAALTEEMGRALVPGAYLSTLLAARQRSTRRASTKVSGRDRNGEVKSTLALLESSGSWDMDAVQMPALTGEKIFVPDAGIADVISWWPRADSGELALYIVDGKAVAKTAMPAMDLTRRLYKVGFENAEGELSALAAMRRARP